MPARATARPTWVSEPGARGAAAGYGGMDGPVGPIGVQGQGQTITLQDRPQGRHHGRDALAPRAELGIEQLLGGVIDHGQQGEPLPGE
jgi:hypothetical protein